MSPTPRPITDRAFRLGENPLWDARRGRLLWTDIDAGELWQWGPGADAERIYRGPRVGGFTIQDDGRPLLFRERDVALMDDDGAVHPVLPFDDPGCTRFNDVIAAPDGSVFAGAVGLTDESGGLFHLAHDARLANLFRGTRFPNGMAFSLDHRFLYYTCSTSRTIHRFVYDRATGALGARCDVHRATDDTPDGLTIDATGHLWSARWGGARVLRIAPTGSVADQIDVPTRNVTSVTFGADQLRTLFITTAGGPVYACEPGVAGVAELSSRIATSPDAPPKTHGGGNAP